MTHLTGAERAQFVQGMFGRIAKRYDLLNRIMTIGQDASWRRDAIRRLAIKPDTSIIDLGSGTGDIAMEIAVQHPSVFVVASDFTAQMVRVGQKRPNGDTVAWLIADAERLPFAKESFSGVISGFLLRNVANLEGALLEQFRLLNLDGQVVSLDTTPPSNNWLKPFLHFHFNYIIPLLGRLIAGDGGAYAYLSSSTQKFLSADSLVARFTRAGFSNPKYLRRMLGTIAIHWASKG